MALIASPFALMGACGGDDTATPPGTGGSGGTSSGTSGGAGTNSGTSGGAGTATGSGGSAAGSGGSAAGSCGSAAGAGGSAAGAGGSAAGAGGAGGSASTDAGSDSGNGNLPMCTSTSATSEAMPATKYCTILLGTCKGGDLKAAYNTQAKCETAYAAGKMQCQSYHVCNAVKSTTAADITMHCGHAQGDAPCN